MSTGLITGCSSGLGRALAQTVLGRGDNVVATAREAIERFGAVVVLVNNAGAST